jgi:hypothetical protein
LYRKIYTILYIHTNIRETTKKECLITRTIRFAYRDDCADMYEDDIGTMPAYEEYVSTEMEKPEYRRIRIGLDRLERTVLNIMSGQEGITRGHALLVLDEVLRKLQEIETLADGVEDSFVWEHILDRIDMIVAIRRHLVAEIRWEIQSDEKCRASA